MTKAIYKHYCTYKHKGTNNDWVTCQEKYDSVEELLKAIIPYATKHPTITIQLCFDVSYQKTEDEGQK